MARKKIYKIKHYKTGYRRKKSAISKLLLGLLGAGVIFSVSFWVVGPILDAMYNKTLEPDVTSSTPATSSKPPVVSSNSETEEPLAPAVSKKYKIVRITEEELLLTDKHADLVNSIVEAGAGAVIIPIRTNRAIYFETKNDLAIRTKSIVDVKLGDLIKALTDKGIETYGEFSVFMDNTAPPLKYGTAEISMGIQFKGNENYLFLDSVNDPESTFWLSPNSPLAKEYLNSLALDVKELGLTSVILKHFYYVKNPNAYYAEGVNRSENLKETLEALKTSFGETNVIVETDIESITNGKADELGGKITDITGNLFLSFEEITEETKTLLKSLNGVNLTISVPALEETLINELIEISGTSVLVG